MYMCVCVCVYIHTTSYIYIFFFFFFHIFFIHSSVNGHFGCFHVSAIVNNAPVNNGVHVSFQIRVFLSFPVICPGLGLLDHMVTLFFVFKGTSRDFPGGPAVKTPCSQCRGPGFHPLSRN